MVQTHERPYSLLITDDDPTIRESLREILAPAGFRTLLAESGEQAIDIIEKQDVHLALMDMHLPRMNGLETIEMVRQIKGVLPTILISGQNDDSLLRKALRAEVYCVLAKPVSRNMVIHVVFRAIEKFY